MNEIKYEKLVAILIEKIDMLEYCYSAASKERDELKAECAMLSALVSKEVINE